MQCTVREGGTVSCMLRRVLRCCLFQIITPFNIYFNSKLILYKHEYWRLFTNFLYFGNLSELHGLPAPRVVGRMGFGSKETGNGGAGAA